MWILKCVWLCSDSSIVSFDPGSKLISSYVHWRDYSLSTYFVLDLGQVALCVALFNT